MPLIVVLMLLLTCTNDLSETSYLQLYSSDVAFIYHGMTSYIMKVVTEKIQTSLNINLAKIEYLHMVLQYLISILPSVCSFFCLLSYAAISLKCIFLRLQKIDMVSHRDLFIFQRVKVNKLLLRTRK